MHRESGAFGGIVSELFGSAAVSESRPSTSGATREDLARWSSGFDRSLEELRDLVDRQQAIVETLEPRTDRLRATLVETVAVLEQTRSSFKSRQLESLRKKLLEVLTES